MAGAVAPGMTATAAPPAEAVRVGSTFVDVGRAATWTPEKWEREFQYLQKAGIGELILAGTMKKDDRTGIRTAFYPTKIPKVTQAPGPDGTPVDVVSPLLRQARKYGMKVWLGTYIDGKSWFTYDDTKDAPRVAANVDITKQVMDELDSQYGSYKDVVKGWYLSSEISTHWAWFWSARKTLAGYYTVLTEKARALTLTQRTMIAPFYNVNALSSSDLWRDLWIPVLTAAPVDVLALQDGTGDVLDEQGKPILLSPAEERQHLETKYTATRAAIDRANADRVAAGKPKVPTALWADLELYNATGWPKPIGDVAAVLGVVKNYVTGYTSWSFTNQTSPLAQVSEAYYRPFVEWNTAGALPRGTVQTPPGLTVTSTGVSWQASQPATGNFLSHYRISTAGVLLDLVYDQLRYDTTWPCVTVEAVDTIGNRSAPATTCAG